ncbi:fimbria/pilus periplasmic chaperone [Escherichia coli]|nr:fimbria/pilus periplasmic chaperone [Escherichia coli]ELW7705913.1 fimbria/pilus periplasmic chaperone [Escherichia coli]
MFKLLFCFTILFLPLSAFSIGMQPETTVLIINESTGEASIKVKNTNSEPSLLQTKIVDIDGFQKVGVFVSPAIVKLDPGDTQVVRFFINPSEKLKSQVLKRIRFIGLPAREISKKNNSALSLSIGQNIPLIITTSKLKDEDSPWEYLKYHYNKKKVILSNNSDYVVRLFPEVSINNKKMKISNSFIRPHGSLEIDFNDNPSILTIRPVGLYGDLRDEYKVEKYNP